MLGGRKTISKATVWWTYTVFIPHQRFRALVDRSRVSADLVGCTGLAAFLPLSVQLEKISNIWKVGCTSRPDDWKFWKALQ